MTYTTREVGNATIVELDRPAVSAPRRITALAFVQRFTDAEAIAIDMASRADTPDAAALRRYMQKVNLASFIDLDDQTLRQCVPSLESMGLIAEGRAAEIMDAPVLPQEIA